MRLKDKAIIVTGSTTGIGEAIARRIVAEGGRVIIHGRDKTAGKRLTKSLGAGRAVLHIDDLIDATAPARIVSAAVKAFGRLDGIVNNAAYILRSNLENTDAELFDRCMAINVRAPMLLIRSGVEYLKKMRGCVLNVGSINGHCGESNQLAYSISKGALLTLSRNLGDALGPAGVRVNHLIVGWVLSENERKLKIREGLPPRWHKNPPRAFVPTGRMTRPQDIASAAVFWLSDESRLFSGCVVELEQYPMIGRNPLKEA